MWKGGRYKLLLPGAEGKSSFSGTALKLTEVSKIFLPLVFITGQRAIFCVFSLSNGKLL